MSIQRVSVPVTVNSQRFLLPPAQQGSSAVQLQQYSHIYTRRLETLRRVMLTEAGLKWPGVRTMEKIIDCEFDQQQADAAAAAGEGPEQGTARSASAAATGGGAGGECIIIGTVYKEMKLRPSVLDEFRDQNGLVSGAVHALAKYTCEDDALLLEDESGRIPLTGPGVDRVKQSLVTGVVPALRGRVDSSGAFEVTDVLYSGDCYSRVPESVAPPDAYVLLVSGLMLGAPQGDSLSLQLLADYVGGRIGSAAEIAEAAKIARVIIAGNSLSTAEITKRKFGDQRPAAKSAAEGGTTNLKQLDVFLSELLSSCAVDLMPGALDPATVALPQQPLHPVLLPHANRFSSFLSVPSPHEVSVGGRVLLGSAGQPVDDVAMQAAAEDSPTEHLDALAATLRWGHICPTAPDTLSSIPLVTSDPFIVDTSSPPHIFFAGNQPSYGSKLVTSDKGFSTRVICVPAFSTTQEAVLVSLKTLESKVVSFKVFNKDSN